MKKWRLINVTSPVVEFEIGGTVFHSEKIKNLKKTPNFANPILERKILVRNISMPLFLTLSPSYFKQQMIGPGIAVALNSYAFFFSFWHRLFQKRTCILRPSTFGSETIVRSAVSLWLLLHRSNHSRSSNPDWNQTVKTDWRSTVSETMRLLN